MNDIYSHEQRSMVMARVRGRGNKTTEIALARLFRENKIAGWRRHRRLFGQPDFLFPKLRLAVFVDGCFWHSCPRHATTPATNRGFWKRKLAANRARDRLVGAVLRKRGWFVLRLWEHELSGRGKPGAIRRVRAAVRARSKQPGWASPRATGERRPGSQRPS